MSRTNFSLASITFHFWKRGLQDFGVLCASDLLQVGAAVQAVCNCGDKDLASQTMWLRYQALMKSRPLLINMATAGGVMLIADTGAQYIEGTDAPQAHVRSPAIDTTRSFVMTTWNAFIFSPTFFFWFGFLDRCFPGASPANVAKKVLVNQVLITIPINAGALGYSVAAENALHATIGGRKWDMERVASEISTRWNGDLQRLFVGSACIWIPVNTLNFLFVPPHLRVLPTILVSCVWNTFLSLTAHRTQERAAPVFPKAAGTEDR
jgi:protein Mpv17